MKKIIVVLLAVLVSFHCFAANSLAGKACCQTSENIDSCEKDNSQNQGPTLLLGYSDQSKFNPIFSFMYFVPLISPTLVEMNISPDCQQQGRFVSYRFEKDDDTFTTVSEFEMIGEGFYKNVFDKDNTIRWNAEINDYPEKLMKVLDYIKFKGEGYGRIEVRGKIKDGVKEVRKVEVDFNARDSRSPVVIKVYDLESQEGLYNYENASNQIVARINSLTFEKTDGQPKMAIKLSAISDSEQDSGFWGSLKGKLANLFLKPIPISKQGNSAMLEFGLYLTNKEDAFTFPRAKNLKENEDSQQHLAANQKEKSDLSPKRDGKF